MDKETEQEKEIEKEEIIKETEKEETKKIESQSTDNLKENNDIINLYEFFNKDYENNSFSTDELSDKIVKKDNSPKKDINLIKNSQIILDKESLNNNCYSNENQNEKGNIDNNFKSLKFKNRNIMSKEINKNL